MFEPVKKYPRNNEWGLESTTRSYNNMFRVYSHRDFSSVERGSDSFVIFFFFFRLQNLSISFRRNALHASLQFSLNSDFRL